jgi:uncharacterized protein
MTRLVLALLVFCLAFPAALADDSVEIETGTGTHVFTIELADTPQLRQRGLMFRQSMAADHGMLFDFERDQEISMWMQNTYIPLDMIFILSDGTVHRIERDTTPFSTRSVHSRGPVRSVLEINAGRSAEIGLRPGDTIRHRIFSNRD